MSEKWAISYYDEKIWEKISRLPDTILAKYIKLMGVIEEYGPEYLGSKHSKALGGGLFELRLKGKEGIARVFYAVVIKKELRVLHAFVKKTQKTPNKEMKLARSRLKEVKADEKR